MLPGFVLMVAAVGALRGGRHRPGPVLRAPGGGGRARGDGGRPARARVRHRSGARRARRRGVRGDARLGAPFLVVLAAGGLALLGLAAAARAAAPSRSRRWRRWPSCSRAVSLPLGVQLFLEGLKTGLLTFGGAYTAVPLLQQSAVEGHGWLTQDQFVDGLAISGILPAPLIIFATFIGYLAGGLGGAACSSPSASSCRRSSSRSSCTGSSSRRRRTSGCARSCSA